MLGGAPSGGSKPSQALSKRAFTIVLLKIGKQVLNCGLSIPKPIQTLSLPGDVLWAFESVEAFLSHSERCSEIAVGGFERV